jgi:hypothetical protein
VGDNSIGYWDETAKTCANGTNYNYLVSTNTIGDGQLSFLDYPDQLIPLTELTFEDVLAGVDAFGNVTPLYYPGTAFTWNYLQGINDSSVPNLLLYGNIDPSLGGTGTVTSLAFTDAQIPGTTVPEPGTLALLGTAAFSLVALRRRQISRYRGRVSSLDAGDFWFVPAF